MADHASTHHAGSTATERPERDYEFEASLELVRGALAGSDSLNSRAVALAGLTGVTLSLAVSFAGTWLKAGFGLTESQEQLLLFLLVASVGLFLLAVGAALAALLPRGRGVKDLGTLESELRKLSLHKGESDSDSTLEADRLRLAKELGRDQVVNMNARIFRDQFRSNDAKGRFTRWAYLSYFLGLLGVGAQAIVLAAGRL